MAKNICKLCVRSFLQYSSEYPEAVYGCTIDGRIRTNVTKCLDFDKGGIVF